MDDDILFEIKKVRLKKLSDTFPGYPCDKCANGQKNCTAFRECERFKGWVHVMFVQIHELFGVAEHGKRKQSDDGIRNRSAGEAGDGDCPEEKAEPGKA